jgi:hypothetical protein
MDKLFAESTFALKRFRLRNLLLAVRYTGQVRHGVEPSTRGHSMPRKGISSVDVIRAYVALIKQGRLPGPRNLRLEMGTGSYTTIEQHMKKLALRHPRLRPAIARRSRRARQDSADIEGMRAPHAVPK